MHQRQILWLELVAQNIWLVPILDNIQKILLWKLLTDFQELVLNVFNLSNIQILFSTMATIMQIPSLVQMVRNPINSESPILLLEQWKTGDWSHIKWDWYIIIQKLGLTERFCLVKSDKWQLVRWNTCLQSPIKEFPEGLNVQVASVFAHELAHQWTGNLVTCSWWDEIWINEGFADIGGYLGLRYAEPTWNWYNEFWNSQHMNGLRVDARPTTRPLINKLDFHSHRTSEIYDTSVYNRRKSSKSKIMMDSLWIPLLK